MRSPKFWYAPHPTCVAHMLRPLGRLYARVTARRVAQGGIKAPVPVICVGNINAGGSGKTPVVMALIAHLPGVHIVSRGFGGALQGPVQVTPAHKAEEVGDEPLLLSAFAPVWVAKDRALGVQAAVRAGAKVILLDDGFQNPAVQKDLAIVVVDAAYGFGNGLCIPAGPLREPVAAGLKRADMLITIGDGPAQAGFEARYGTMLPPDLRHIKGHLAPVQMGMDWQDMPVFAFAGIGHPEKFFKTLEQQGARLVRKVALGDHQPLSMPLLQRLLREAQMLGAQLVTTEKDAMRLPLSYRTQILTLPVRLHLNDEAGLKNVLTKIGVGS